MIKIRCDSCISTLRSTYSFIIIVLWNIILILKFRHRLNIWNQACTSCLVIISRAGTQSDNHLPPRLSQVSLPIRTVLPGSYCRRLNVCIFLLLKFLKIKMDCSNFNTTCSFGVNYIWLLIPFRTMVRSKIRKSSKK
jgi:hypothetical protein